VFGKARARARKEASCIYAFDQEVRTLDAGRIRDLWWGQKAAVEHGVHVCFSNSPIVYVKKHRIEIKLKL
jgi:hypothetical protein